MFLRSFEIFAKPSKLLTMFHPLVQTGRSPAWVIVSLCVTLEAEKSEEFNPSIPSFAPCFQRSQVQTSNYLDDPWEYSMCSGFWSVGNRALHHCTLQRGSDSQLKPAMICLDLQWFTTSWLPTTFALVLDIVGGWCIKTDVMLNRIKDFDV